jgi:hypothetical protein
MASFLQKFKLGNVAKLQAKLSELDEKGQIFEQREQEFEETEQLLANKQAQLETLQKIRNDSETKAYELQKEFSLHQQAIEEAEAKLRLLKQQAEEAEKAYIKEKEGVKEQDRQIVDLQKELAEEKATHDKNLEEHMKEVAKYEEDYELLKEKGLITEEISIEKREEIEQEEIIPIFSKEEIAVSKEEELILPSETIVLSDIVSFPNLSTLKSNMLYIFEKIRPLPQTVQDNGLGEIVLKIEFSYSGKDVKFYLSLHKENNSLAISYLNEAMTLVDVGFETPDGILIKQDFEEKTINEMLSSALRTTTIFKM